MHNPKIFQERRIALCKRIQQLHPHTSDGYIMLIAGFEQSRIRFRQESSFYYFTGIEEPATIALISLDSKTTLYMPASTQSRTAWMHSKINLQDPQKSGLAAIIDLGKPSHGFLRSALLQEAEYENIITALRTVVAKKGSLFTLAAADAHQYIEQKIVLQQLNSFVPGLAGATVDISAPVAAMRRKKSRFEIEQLYKAAEITMIAQEAAASALGDMAQESQIQAGIEYIFTEAEAQPAFPSIVASGKNSTILHYHANTGNMRDGDLVVIDIGAEKDYYCADLTRTYPVSGEFTKRQRQVYDIVLATQEFIAQKAKPGLWLRNAEKPDASLHHMAVEFMKKKGYSEYFIHGIGHFLGLDVHDVGDSNEPLQEGDVITIEPGIYIPQEKLGIRIEDNFWIVKDGAECLSQDLPRDAKSVEEMAQQSLDIEEEDLYENEEDFN